ncbi:MAG: hypothetical protein K0Q59_3255 [Paenibacillus sp.]|nr:hypothetical protein [Paenibacillus sp.]
MHDIFGFSTGADEQDWDVGDTADLLANFQAIDAGHLDIEKHQIWSDRFELTQCRQSVIRFDHGKAGFVQIKSKQFSNIFIIFNDQYDCMLLRQSYPLQSMQAFLMSFYSTITLHKSL